MKKSILNLGKVLKKAELKKINGGFTCNPAYSQSNCDDYCQSAWDIGAWQILADHCFWQPS